MREYITRQLREHSLVRGKQKAWVSELDDRQLYQLFQRLRNGESAKSIAPYIQKVWEVDPVKRRQAERLKERLDRGVLALIDQLGPDGRSKLIEANIKLLENIEKRGLVDMEVEGDGNWLHHPFMGVHL